MEVVRFARGSTRAARPVSLSAHPPHPVTSYLDYVRLCILSRLSSLPRSLPRRAQRRHALNGDHVAAMFTLVASAVHALVVGSTASLPRRDYVYVRRGMLLGGIWKCTLVES